MNAIVLRLRGRSTHLASINTVAGVIVLLLGPLYIGVEDTSAQVKRADDQGAETSEGKSFEIRPPAQERVTRPRGEAARLLAADAPLTLEQVKTRAAEFLRKNMDLEAFTLKHRSARTIGGKTTLRYALEYEGIPLTTRSSALIVVGPQFNEAQVLQTENVPSLVKFSTKPTVSRETAIDFAKQDFRQVLQELAREAENADENLVQGELVNSEPRLAIEASADPNEQERGILVWNFTMEVRSQVNPQKFEYSISATEEPRVAARIPLLHYEHAGTVTGPRWDPTPAHSAVDGFLPFARVTRNGNATVHADAMGSFRFNGRGHATFVADLVSPWFVIDNVAGGGQELTASAMGDDTAPIDLRFMVQTMAPNAEFDIAQVSAFYWAHEARNFCADILQPGELEPVTIRVNLNSSCNAWFQAPNTIGLFRSSASLGRNDGCINRAYQDTIFHEFGHAVDYVCDGIEDGAYSEGFGDAIAILYHRSPCYGRNTRGEGTCLRSAENNLMWPSSSLGIHERGRIFSGFVWELVKELSASQAEDQAYSTARVLVLGSASLSPNDIQQAVRYVLEWDDDDGDLSNGTPHFAAIKKAAQHKGLWNAAWEPVDE